MPSNEPEADLQIIWGGPPPPPVLGNLNRRSTRWWNQFKQSQRDGASLEELEGTSCRIVEALPEPLNWGMSPNPFKGLVVGAVQSGKTASMIGVSAIALDQGFRIIIILAGLKDDLRRQTARRVNSDLLVQNDVVEGFPDQTTLPGEIGPGPLGGYAMNYFYDANYVPSLQILMERALRRDEPCVIVVKKNPVSLQKVANALRTICRRPENHSLPILVLDDECDEASIESQGGDAVIPDAIARIWRSSSPGPNVAYIGYTATSAASLLQNPNNELFPSHFVQILRYPDSENTPLSYGLPNGDSWYTGGNTWYSDYADDSGEDIGFLVSPTVTGADLVGSVAENASLQEALIAYFISGAMRLALQPDRSFDDPGNLPLPHSMMIQTSISVDVHNQWRDAIRDLLDGVDIGEGTVLIDDQKLIQQVADEEGRWRKWFDEFQESRDFIYQRRPHTAVQASLTWLEVKELLPVVFRNTNLKAVNSDGNQGQTLDYSKKVSSEGSVVRPQDIYVIVIGGSKLSRGLTIEGLCISYYARLPNRPHEDTTLQSSRWFGYRGLHLEFCRLFTTEDSWERLKDIQANDFDHRMKLADLMVRGESLEAARIALRTSPSCVLTAKLGVGTVHDLAFSPSSHVYNYTEMGELSEHNQSVAAILVERIRDEGGEEVQGLSSVARGILSRGWSASQVADVLDELAYTAHNPDRERYPMPEHHRPEDVSRNVGTLLDTHNDPYIVAAYLRYWSTRDNPPPLFNVGVTFGTMTEGIAPFNFPLSNRLISSRGRVEGSWSGASGAWKGDAYFDGPDDNLIGMNHLRLEGSSGLLLLHVVHKDARGRSGNGIVREFHSPAFGIAIPAGGPSFSVVLNYAL